MKKIKLYRKILLFQVGVITTQLVHIKVTQARGYKAIGGELLLVPVMYIVYKMMDLLIKRIKETNEHFKRRELNDNRTSERVYRKTI